MSSASVGETTCTGQNTAAQRIAAASNHQDLSGISLLVCKMERRVTPLQMTLFPPQEDFLNNRGHDTALPTCRISENEMLRRGGVGSHTGDVADRRGKYLTALPPALPMEAASAVGTGAPAPRLL